MRHFKEGPELHPHELHGPTALPFSGAEGLSFALLQATGGELLPGAALELVEDGDVFDALIQLIQSARRSVHILMFIWRPSQPSDRVVEALLARARAGVRCRILVDPFGSEELTGAHDFSTHVEDRLVRGGCEVHYYRPLSGKLLGRLLGRNHQKLAVVDGREALTGGFGIWRAWLGRGRGPDIERGWRDCNVLVRGPVVRAMQTAFAVDWLECGGGFLAREEFPELTARGSAHAGYFASTGQLGLTRAERVMRLVFAAARRRLWIANAYFTPPDRILEQLEHKRAQGVEIRVLAPGPVHDVPIVRAAQRSTYERLLRAGAQLWEYQPSMFHAKTVLVDDWLAVVGSINLDPLSLNKLSEGAVVAADPRLVEALERAWVRDLAVSTEVTLERGGRTTLTRRLSRQVLNILGKDR